MILRSKQEWLELFKKHEISDLSAAKFCRDEKLCARYFSKRKQQLGWTIKNVIKTHKKKKPTNGFIKVSVSKSNHSFSLEYKELRLNWNELPPSQWLSDFVKML